MTRRYRSCSRCTVTPHSGVRREQTDHAGSVPAADSVVNDRGMHHGVPDIGHDGRNRVLEGRPYPQMVGLGRIPASRVGAPLRHESLGLIPTGGLTGGVAHSTLSTGPSAALALLGDTASRPPPGPARWSWAVVTVDPAGRVGCRR